MLKIDDNLLQEIGLGTLPTEEKRGLLSHIYETLEMRVGMRLADQMTNEQLDEFEQYFEAKDDAGAFKWLETNFPNYKEIVNEEFEKLKTEVAQTASQILAASQQNIAAHPLQPQIPGSQPAVAMSPQSAPTGQSPQQPQPWSAQPSSQPQPLASAPRQPQAWQQPTQPQQPATAQSQPYQMPQQAPQPSYQPPAPMTDSPQPYDPTAVADSPPQPPAPTQPWPPQPQPPLTTPPASSDQQPPQAA